jgi:trehalose utilization protein
VLVVEEAELLPAVVAEAADPHSGAARLRHPEDGLLERGAAELQRLLRAGHAGHYRHSLPGEEVEQRVPRRLDRGAGRR